MKLFIYVGEIIKPCDGIEKKDYCIRVIEADSLKAAVTGEGKYVKVRKLHDDVASGEYIKVYKEYIKDSKYINECGYIRGGIKISNNIKDAEKYLKIHNVLVDMKGDQWSHG